MKPFQTIRITVVVYYCGVTSDCAHLITGTGETHRKISTHRSLSEKCALHALIPIRTVGTTGDLADFEADKALSFMNAPFVRVGVPR